MTDPIRAALEKAVAIDQAPTRHIAPEKHVAEIIAAFNCTIALSTTDPAFSLHLHEVANAALAAAKEEPSSDT
jgi:hypothetical protein